MEITQDQLNELTSVMEDAVEYFCHDKLFAGETCWKVLECLAIAKQAEFASEVTWKH